MAGNLTRDEARERARLLTVGSSAVELDLTRGDTTFGSTTTIRFEAADPGASTFVDLHGATVREVTLNGKALDPKGYDAGKGRILLQDLAAKNELRVVADCAYSHTGEGLHRFTDPVDQNVYLYTQFETADAHRMYACFDQPDLKAPFALMVVAPEGWEVATNEAAAAVVGHRHVFPATPRISTYITALVAGPYHVVRDEYRRADDSTIPLGVFCRASLAEHLDAEVIIEVTRQGFAFFENVFDRVYPFDKYDQLFVPEFNAGAMENAGCVVFSEDFLFRSRVTNAEIEHRAEGILHEMAHMWFGDLVTMRWWDDLWLNESFATYMSVLCQAEATNWTNAWTTFANLKKAWAYRQDQLSSTHPIAAGIPDIRAVEVNFDGITYAKGASVLKQLAAYVGLENFLDGVRLYFQRHAWGNTVLADLLDALEETSGRGDLANWSKEWLETAGVNTIRPVYKVDGEGNFTSFLIKQEAQADHPTLRSHRLAVGLYDRTAEGIVRRRRIQLNVRGAKTAVPELVRDKRPDLVLLNDDDLAYAKIRLDEHSLKTLVEGIGDIKESLPQALCWSAAWDMTRDAEMATRDYVKLVIRGIRGVTDIAVAQTTLRQARTAVQQYAAPEWRPQCLQLMADTLYGLARDAEEGSDFQLAYVQAFTAVAGAERHLACVRGLLDGTEVLTGLKVDTELRWALLRRLVSAGKASEDAIAAEVKRDPTAAGERHAAACRAALPTSGAKAAAWEKIVGGKLPNAIFRATLGGFADAEDTALLVPYVEKYFAGLCRVWKEWSSDMSQMFAEIAYPFLIIDQSTIDRTEAYIKEQNPPPALRRLLSEGRDGVARALRARACDHRAIDSTETGAQVGKIVVTVDR